MANHLEQLISEWLEYKGYFVRNNVNVGKLPHGGFEGELDIVAYHPVKKHLIHVEPSNDAHTWQKREERFKKKFESGKKYIIPKILPWLPPNKNIEQWAVLWGSNKNHKYIGGGKVIPVWEMYRTIAKEIILIDPAGNAIPEQFPLLRTMQYTLHWATPEKFNKDTEQN